LAAFVDGGFTAGFFTNSFEAEGFEAEGFEAEGFEGDFAVASGTLFEGDFASALAELSDAAALPEVALGLLVGFGAGAPSLAAPEPEAESLLGCDSFGLIDVAELTRSVTPGTTGTPLSVV
jgi:hypothetical protein